MVSPPSSPSRSFPTHHSTTQPIHVFFYFFFRKQTGKLKITNKPEVLKSRNKKINNNNNNKTKKRHKKHTLTQKHPPPIKMTLTFLHRLFF